MTRNEMAEVMEKVFVECKTLRGAGQAEYAHREDNAFANFERVGERLGISREKTLLVYLEKHIDGVHSWVKGHRSQRESVKGRINDIIVYLCLLRGMVEQAEIAALPSVRCDACGRMDHEKCCGGACACTCGANRARLT
jgi:hypothetical protein